MKTYNLSYNTREVMEEVGLAHLSGESCNMGTRFTCDVSPEAIPYVEEYLAVTLRKEGMNGWAKGPTGPWVSGYSAASDYSTGSWQRKEGWVTDPGKGIHMPHSMVTELVAFLLLRLRRYAAVAYFEGGKTQGLQFNTQILAFETNLEFEGFKEDFYEQYYAFEKMEETGERPPYDHENIAYHFGRWAYEKGYTKWRFWPNSWATTNTHYMSGRTLV